MSLPLTACTTTGVLPKCSAFLFMVLGKIPRHGQAEIAWRMKTFMVARNVGKDFDSCALIYYTLYSTYFCVVRF